MIFITAFLRTQYRVWETLRCKFRNSRIRFRRVMDAVAFVFI